MYSFIMWCCRRQSVKNVNRSDLFDPSNQSNIWTTTLTYCWREFETNLTVWRLLDYHWLIAKIETPKAASSVVLATLMSIGKFQFPIADVNVYFKRRCEMYLYFSYQEVTWKRTIQTSPKNHFISVVAWPW